MLLGWCQCWGWGGRGPGGSRAGPSHLSVALRLFLNHVAEGTPALKLGGGKRGFDGERVGVLDGAQASARGAWEADALVDDEAGDCLAHVPAQHAQLALGGGGGALFAQGLLRRLDNSDDSLVLVRVEGEGHVVGVARVVCALCARERGEACVEPEVDEVRQSRACRCALRQPAAVRAEFGEKRRSLRVPAYTTKVGSDSLRLGREEEVSHVHAQDDGTARVRERVGDDGAAALEAVRRGVRA